ncbi:MAG TPA: hypothetical protein PLJ84_02000 [Bacteroidales bacterium]|nr:hypothetical protein [Bacteroidales bacterium]HPT01341.1 hypothetical protein [Bacteroidales bacterium]
MKKLVICFSLALVFIGLPSSAQITLLLEKPGTVTYYMYQKHDFISIRYKTKPEGFFDAGVITEITDSTVQINGNNRYRFSDITAVFRGRPLVRIFSNVAIICGAGFLGLTLVNGVIGSGGPALGPDVVSAAGSVIFAGLVASAFKNRRFILGENWRLRTVDLSILKPDGQQ